MDSLAIFDNKEFGTVRTIEENGKVMFCGSDVARALGYAKPHNAISTHCKSVTLKQGNDDLGRLQKMSFIPEGDVYRLIAHSKLPGAERFEKWVFDEVLPTIRKTGGYVANEDNFINTYLHYADEQTKQLFSATLHTIRDLNKKIEHDKPKVLFADAVESSHTSILVGELAKLIKQNGVDIGQKRLFDWLRTNGYLIKSGSSKNMPTQKAMDMGLFEIKERTINDPNGLVRITRTTKVTGKGQTYFINKFLT